jgi:hypothetical protein
VGKLGFSIWRRLNPQRGRVRENFTATRAYRAERLGTLDLSRGWVGERRTAGTAGLRVSKPLGDLEIPGGGGYSRPHGLERYGRAANAGKVKAAGVF